MKNIKKILSFAFSLFFVLFLVLAIADTKEKEYDTNFNQDNIIDHMKNFSINGPHSIYHKEENELVVKYVTDTLEGYGVVNEDTTTKPAYLIQEFVSNSSRYQDIVSKNIIVSIPANVDRSGDAIMFMAHVDSVTTGTGTSDDSVCCGTMLEAIRYYLDKINNGFKLSNDLVFVFTNGEEHGLLGANGFMNEFNGFDNLLKRIKFGVNLESRGTSGTLIMFETSANNYKTIQLFSEVNKNIFSCSVATMIYDMMPNGTDFSEFKDFYQGINMANIGSGENYHTENDVLENMELTYMTQQAKFVDALIDKLAFYELDSLYDAEESAIFYTYLNITTVIYNHTACYIFGALALLMLIGNIVLYIIYRKENNIKKSLISIASTIVGLGITTLLTLVCYYLFQLIAAMFGTINIIEIGKISYSNNAIIVGIGILAIAVSALTSHYTCKWFKVESRDLVKVQAYIHTFIGAILSFVLPDASYIFIFSGLLLMVNELAITIFKNKEIDKFHFELLVMALYMPVIIPLISLATTALGLNMCYIFALVFGLGIYNVGIFVSPYLKYLSIRKLFKKSESTLEGGLYVLGSALIIFLIVCMIKPNANVNLQGKQGNSMFPYDDALIYVVNEDGSSEYRVYDLDAYSYLKEYSPKMEYQEKYYVGNTNNDINVSLKTKADGKALNITRINEKSYVYVTITNVKEATSFTINDGTLIKSYDINEGGSYTFFIYSDLVLSIDKGSVDISYQEFIVDYQDLIPSGYEKEEKLHFNLWLLGKYNLA